MARARADDRPRDRRAPPRGRRLRGGDRRRGRAWVGTAYAGYCTRMTPSAGPSRLLIRDLEQLASGAGGGAPLRGGALGEADVVENAYILCDGGSVGRVGRMRELEPFDEDVEEINGRGLCAVPGFVDCHTHACFAGDRVDEFALRARGATYEELHAAGGGILATVRATREAAPDELREAVRRHLAWMLRFGTTTVEAKSGYGLDRETELESLRAIRAEGGAPSW